FTQLFFVCGARNKNAREMLDASLSSIGRFSRRDRLWDMSCKWKFLLLGLVRDSKVRLARKQGVDLNEIGALLLNLNHRLSSFGFVSDSNRAGPDWFWSIHNRAGDDHPGRQEGSFLDLFSPHEMYRSAPPY